MRLGALSILLCEKAKPEEAFPKSEIPFVMSEENQDVHAEAEAIIAGHESLTNEFEALLTAERERQHLSVVAEVERRTKQVG